MANINEFMNKIGCEKWPKRWEEFFEEAVTDFEENGCELLNPEYYDNLHNKYGILNEFLECYKLAAKEIAKDKNLSIYLHLWKRAMKDRDKIMSDVYSYSLPAVPEGLDEIAVNMLCGLAICSGAEYCHSILTKRNIPKDMADHIMNTPEGGVRRYFERNSGKYGYSLFNWFQLAIDAKLYNINRLEIEVNCPFEFNVRVYGNEKGEYVTLADGLDVHESGHILGTLYFEDDKNSWRADITEDDKCICGYAFREDTLLKKELIKLNKNEWKELLRKDDPVVNLHIPASGKFTPEIVDESLKDIKEFLKKYYPDYKYKAFACCSWFLDPQNELLLKKDSNILHFAKRFTRFTHKDWGKSAFSFVYQMDNPVIEDLPEKTSLQRAMKKHFLSGKTIYNVAGYFFDKQ